MNLAYHGTRAHDQNFNITLECELDHTIAPIELVPQDMTRVFLDLLGNGFYAAAKRSGGAGDGFRPVLKVATCDHGDEIEIRVRDNGTGIPPEFLDKLFEPFFTTKPTGEGTSLGLSISYDIVAQQHGGTIEFDSMFGEFTEFTTRPPWSRRAITHRDDSMSTLTRLLPPGTARQGRLSGGRNDEQRPVIARSRRVGAVRRPRTGSTTKQSQTPSHSRVGWRTR